MTDWIDVARDLITLSESRYRNRRRRCAKRNHAILPSAWWGYPVVARHVTRNGRGVVGALKRKKP